MRLTHSLRSWAWISIAALSAAACAGTTATERGNARITGVVNGHVSVNAMDSAAKSSVHVGLLEQARGTTELLSLELAPLASVGEGCGIGGIRSTAPWFGIAFGFGGLRLQILPIEAALGTFTYRPDAPRDRPCPDSRAADCRADGESEKCSATANGAGAGGTR